MLVLGGSCLFKRSCPSTWPLLLRGQTLQMYPQRCCRILLLSNNVEGTSSLMFHQSDEDYFEGCICAGACLQFNINQLKCQDMMMMKTILMMMI